MTLVTRLRLLFLPLFALILVSAPATVAASDDAPDLTPLPEVDEQLFLVTTLRYAYDSWPKDMRDMGQYVGQLDQLRYNAVRYREYVNEKGLDPKIASLYEDLAATVDAQKQSLIRARAIRADAQAQQDAAARKVVGGLMATVMTGGTVGTAGLLNAANSVSASGELGKTADASIEAAQAEVNRQLADALARAESVCLVLSEKYKWKRGETGIGSSQREQDELKGLVAQRDTEAVIRWCSDISSRRSRDPVAAVLLYSCKAAAAGADVDAQFAAAQGSIRAARLVPAGELYDRDRGRFAYVAARLAAAAATRQHTDAPRSPASVKKARFAAALFAAASEFSPLAGAEDEGRLRQEWATVLAIDGKLDEALAQASRVRDAMKDDPGYAYNMACLCSLAGQVDVALQWLRQAMSLGYSNVRHAQADPDLENIRRSRANEWQALTTVSFAWEIVPVLLGPESVKLTNTSAFPLTNVVLTGQVQAAGGPIQIKPLGVATLAPGASCKWDRAFMLPTGNRFEQASATVTCDQAPATGR